MPFLFGISGKADEPVTVVVRASRHPDFLRIVVEGEESVIQTAKTKQAGNMLSVEFQSVLNLVTLNVPFKINVQGKTLNMAVGPFKTMKTMHLNNPSRLVIDIYQGEAPILGVQGIQEHKGKTEIKPNVGAIIESTIQTGVIKSVVIDPGHGGSDPGLSAGNIGEKAIDLDLSKRLKAMLARSKIRVYLTRQADQSMGLIDRALSSDKLRPDAFISIHVGTGKNFVIYTGSGQQDTSESYSIDRAQEKFTGSSASLAKIISQYIDGDFGAGSSIITHIRSSVLSYISSPAIIIEVPSLASMSYSDASRDRITRAISKAILNYGKDTETTSQ